MKFTWREFIFRLAIGILGAVLGILGWEFEGRYPLLAIILGIIGLGLMAYCLYFLFTAKMEKSG